MHEIVILMLIDCEHDFMNTDQLNLKFKNFSLYGMIVLSSIIYSNVFYTHCYFVFTLYVFSCRIRDNGCCSSVFDLQHGGTDSTGNIIMLFIQWTSL